MEQSHRITMLGTGLIGMFYTMTLHGQRKRDRVHTVYSRSAARAQQFAADWNIPKHTANLAEAIMILKLIAWSSACPIISTKKL